MRGCAGRRRWPDQGHPLVKWMDNKVDLSQPTLVIESHHEALPVSRRRTGMGP